MIEESLLKKNFVGRDGFYWWIGQVVNSNVWKRNIPELPVKSQEDLPGFKRRVKVRIMGYHTADTKVLSDDDLPWAYCMMPVTAGGSLGGMSQSVNFSGGEYIFGFFLDGEDGQQPVVMGVLDKSSQLNFGKDIPPIGGTPFQGYSNGLVESPHNIKEDGAPGKTDSSAPPVSSGGGGVKVSPTLATASAVLEAPRDEVKDHGTKAAHENAKNTGAVKPAQKCADDNPGEGISLLIQRLQKIMSFIKKQQGIFLDPLNLKLGNIKDEITRAAAGIAGYVKDIMEKVRGVMTKEVTEKMAKLSVKLPIDKMGKFKDTLDKALEGLGCLFEKIMAGLEGLLNGLIQDMLGKVTGALDCIINNVIGNMLNSALGAVNNVLGSITGILDSLVGAVGAITVPLVSAAKFLASLKALFSCKKETECTEIAQFHMLYGNQSEKPSDFAGLVSGALGGGSKIPEPIGSLLKTGSDLAGSVGGLVSAATGVVDAVQGGIGAVTNAIETVAGIPGQALDALQECNPFADLCQPPLAVIFGGGIVETTANAIINQAGSIIGVDLQGSNALNAVYNSVPSINFTSNCGQGGGAAGRVILNPDGTIGKVVIDEPGINYLPVPDGSVGASGQVFANTDETIVRTDDGEQIVVTPDSGCDIPAGSVVFIPSGGSVEFPPGTVDQQGNVASGFQSGKGLTDGNGFIVPGETNIITPVPVIDNTAGTGIGGNVGGGIGGGAGAGAGGIGAGGIGGGGIGGGGIGGGGAGYTVVMELDEINVDKTGISYNNGNTITVTGDGNTLILEPILSVNGSILGVNIPNDQRGLGFTSIPEVVINTQTGAGAKLTPYLRIKYRGDNNIQEVLDRVTQDQIISVVNCVGKIDA